MRSILAALALFALSSAALAEPPAAAGFPAPVEKDFSIRDFRFRSGQSLPEVRLHYRTIGEPRRDAAGHIRNAVLLLHGSSGDASQLLAPSFSGALFGPGQPLDAARYFLILPDLIGNGQSTRPSEGLKARFPRYGYLDMVELEHRLVSDGLGIERLVAVLGVSMGGMHAWLWGERYPGMMDALVPIAAQPVAVEGRNLLWRRILTRAIRSDPEWQDGEYAQQPRGFLSALPMFDMLIQSPVRLGESLTSYAAADAYLEKLTEKNRSEDANNILYRFEASFDYDPAPDLEKIQAPLLAILFADDELNPPETRVMERLLPRVKRGSMLLVPAGPQTQGHRTQVQAAVWRERLAEFLGSLPPRD